MQARDECKVFAWVHCADKADDGARSGAAVEPVCEGAGGAAGAGGWAAAAAGSGGTRARARAARAAAPLHQVRALARSCIVLCCAVSSRDACVQAIGNA